MKTTLALLAALISAGSSLFARTIYLYDDFNGSTVDSTLWNVVLPYGQSGISQSGGTLTTTGRGTLETIAGFSSPYSISGRVKMNASVEHFEVTFRSNLLPGYQSSDGREYYELMGLKFGFSMDGGQIGISQFTETNAPLLAVANYNLVVGQFYDFTITDMGNLITVSINGTEVLSANTSFSTGNCVAFQSREFAGTSSSIDFIQIASVPEPSSLGIVSFAAGIFICTRRKNG
jgi:hypothetical protein